MDCPYCEEVVGRMVLHQHLVDAHSMEIERDGAVYRIDCPYCDEEAAVDVGDAPGLDEEDAGEFAVDAAVMAFDVLLDHVELEHGS